jgi:hypothetical protein
MTTATTTAKKANRGHLLRAAKKGNFWVKCCFHRTDDYARDNANNYGKMDDFARVYIVPDHASELSDRVEAMYDNGATHEEVEPIMEELREQRYAHRLHHDELSHGMVKMRDWDFRTASGHVFGTVESGSFGIHSNLNYDYEIRG